MKRILTSVVAATAALSLMAEGYQINTLSTKQLGMGHAGTAMKLGAESMIFNPAGLGFSDKTLDITGSVTGIKADAEARIDGKRYETENGLSTPMAFNAAFKIYDNLQAGISFYTPYGSGINWTNAWPGALLSQKVDLKMFSIQPTVAWRIIPRLSIGAGLMITWGNVNLDKGVVSGATFDALAGSMGVPSALGDMPAASINLTGTSQVALGANVGVMYEINDKWSVGSSFRTHMSMKVKAGTAAVSYANDMAKTVLEPKLGNVDKANFKAQMPAPYVWNIGVAYKPIKALTLAFDAQLTGWKTYRQLNIEFPEQLKDFNQNIPKNYSNAWCFKLGAQYALTERFDLRAGLMIDTTPVNKNHYNPETPGMTKVEPTVGFSFRPIKRLSIDFAFMYIAGTGVKNARCSYEELGAIKEFKADYDVQAFAPSLGISYSF